MTMPLDEGLENNPELQLHPVSDIENRAFRRACLAWAVFGLTLAALCWPENSLFRAPDGSLTSPQAPVMQAIVPLLFLFFAVPGLAYGFAAKTFSDSTAVIRSMENVLKMAAFLPGVRLFRGTVPLCVRNIQPRHAAGPSRVRNF